MLNAPSALYIVIVPLSRGRQICGAFETKEEAERQARLLSPRGCVVQYSKPGPELQDASWHLELDELKQ